MKKHLATAIALFAFALPVPVAAQQAMPAPTAVANNTTDPAPLTQGSAAFPNTEEIDAAFLQYAQASDKHFDVNSARADAVNPDIIAIGEQYNLMLDNRDICVRSDTAQPAVAGMGFTERWNWCGRDVTDGGEPVNSADHECRNHDQCLQQGRPTCDCDAAFVNGLRAVKSQYKGADRIYIEAAIRAVPRAHGCHV